MFREFALYYGPWSKPKRGKRKQANGKRFYWFQLGPFTAKLVLATTEGSEGQDFARDVVDEDETTGSLPN